MAEKVGEIYYDVTLELDQMIKDQRRAQQHVDKTADSLQRLTPIAAAAKAALSGLAVMKIIDMADEWGQYASRIKMATQSAEEYAYVQERMLASANATFRSVRETRESFIQLSPVLREMGLSLGQSVDVIDTFSGLLVVNAASAEKAKGAQEALSKSLQKGKIDADAWMSIYSTLDSVVDLIAESSGKSAEEIRKLGAEGKLGIDLLVNGLSGGVSKVAKQVEEMPTTVRDAITAVTNGLQEYIGWSNETHGITATIAEAVEMLGKNFSVLADGALVAVTMGLSRYAGGMAVAAVATAAKTAATARSAAAEVALAQAEVAQTAAALAKIRALSAVTANTTQVTAATLAYEAANKRLSAAQIAASATATTLGIALRGILGFLGGPVGIAIIAGLAAISFTRLGDSASNAAPKVDLLTASVNELGDANLKLMRTELMKKVSEMGAFDSAAGKANARIETLNGNLRQFPGSAKAKEWRDEIERLEASTETESESLGKLREQLKKVDEEIAGRQKGVSSAKITKADPEVAKRLQSMREEAELAKLAGAARARLQAIQRLGENATVAERAEAEKLATTIHDLTEARKKLGESSAADKFDSTGYLSGLSAAAATEWEKVGIIESQALREHDKLLAEKKISIQAHEEGVTLIRQKAVLERAAINDTTFQKEIDRIQAASDAEADMERQAAELGRALTESVQTPLERLNAELLRYDSLLAAGTITQQTHARASVTAKKDYEESLNKMDQFTVRFAESVQDQLGDTLYDSLTGDFDNIGKAWTQMLMRMMAQAAAADLSRSLFGSKVSGGTGSGILGGLMGGALGGLGDTLGMSIGGTYGPKTQAGLDALVGNLPGRANGGGVSAGSMYEVNERGTPELLTVGNKQLLMMAGQSGSVTPLDTGRMNVATVPSPEGRGGGATAIINMKFINAPSQPEVKQTQGAGGQIDVEVIFKQLDSRAADGIASGSSAQYRATKQRFRLQD